MNEILEIKGKIYEVVDGQVTKIKVDDTIFEIKSSEEKTPIQEIPIEKQIPTVFPAFETEKEEIDKGAPVEKFQRFNIYSNILNEIRKGIEDELGDRELKDIIKKYYPYIKSKSVSSYLWVYRNYLERKENNLEVGKKLATISGVTIRENVLNDIKAEVEKGNYDFTPILRKYHPNIQNKSILKYQQSYKKYLGLSVKVRQTFFRSRRPYRKVHKRRPPNAQGFSKAYKTWITKDEYMTVKRAVNSWNFVATTESVIKKTGLPENRVRATLKYLVDNHDIYWKNKGLSRIYHPCV